MTERVSSLEGTKNAKLQCVLWMVGSFGLFALSLLENSIRGPKLWTIFLFMIFATSISALKLHSLVRGTGWVFPRTHTVLLWIVPIQTFLYLWFSR